MGTVQKRRNRPKPETRRLKAAEISEKLDKLAHNNAKRNNRLLKEVFIHPLRFEDISLKALVEQKKAGRSRSWPKNAQTEVYWGANSSHMAVDKDNLPLALHFPGYLGKTGNMFKYCLLRSFAKAVGVSIRKGADANNRDSLEGYPYLNKESYISGVIQLVGSWTAIGHSNDEPTPSRDVLKSAHAFKLSMECLRELAFTSRAIDDLLSKIDPAAYATLHEARKRLRRVNAAYAALTSLDPTYLHGRSIIFNRATRGHLDIRDPAEVLTPILVVGKFVKGGELRIEKLGLTMSYLPGTLIFIRGSVLPHEVSVFSGGKRISIAHFIHKALLVQVGISDIPMSPYTESPQYVPLPL
ncbi:hypothetical protein AURDEDRAFT_172961 [Auricularia subglabra TFB-10046 SS5]|uniref:Uncharacterized protein n=1 Tax=Auricularia subglabra (strain TFB-10046 / SS5) TaxID=717982 RepID=J0LI93_AURST|nr:hypothetical protein AURDEDRAFT_172961 [Auricularia subglabra TFB-10046 SS5]